MDFCRLRPVRCRRPRKSQPFPGPPHRENLMKPGFVTFCASLMLVAGGAAAAAEPEHMPSPRPVVLAGHTLNAVAYVFAPPGSHRGGLDRFMLQAYLAPGGRALVRVWDEGRGAYTP